MLSVHVYTVLIETCLRKPWNIDCNFWKAFHLKHTRGVPEIRRKVPKLYSCCLSSSQTNGHNTRGFRNNVDFFNNFAMLCSMVIKIISICFLILLPSFPRVWLGSDDFAQSYRLSKRVTNMNPAHVKDDVNEVAIFWLMHFAFRAHFLSKYSPLPHKKAMNCLYRCIHRLYTSLYYPWSQYVTMLEFFIQGVNYQCNVNIVSETFGFHPQPVSSRIKYTLSSNLLHNLKQVHD